MPDNLLNTDIESEIIPAAAEAGTDLNLIAGNYILLLLQNGTDLQVSADIESIQSYLFNLLVGRRNEGAPIQYGTSDAMPTDSSAKIYIKYDE